MKVALKHLKKILIHKWWVFYYACKLGIIWKGITHDLSKFSWVEFSESIKYYQGDKSPIPIAKKEQGYSKAWQHHKGRNPHHYEYWVDWDSNDQLYIIPMPYDYVMEMLADWLGAFRAYNGYINYNEELNWWKKKEPNAYIHPITKQLITMILDRLAKNEYSESSVYMLGLINSDKYWRKWYYNQIQNHQKK